MASHASTPQSVLEAPHSIPVAVSEQSGQNRHGRRHVPLDVKGKPIPTAASITIPKAARVAATNVPLTKTPKMRRSKKARRHALRFT